VNSITTVHISCRIHRHVRV